MKRFFPFLLIVIFLVSCTSAATPEIKPPTVTATVAPFEPTVTALPPSPTSTPEVCDPFRVDFCITEGNFIFQRPIQPPGNTAVDVTYLYASTANGTREPHHGVEFLNKFGTPVYAVADGTVVFANPDTEPKFSPWPNFYGNVIVIKHADDLYTLYAHLSKIDVQVNQQIAAGEQIGEVGQSGVAIGPHLHLEVRHGNVEDYFSTLNPELWLIPNKSKNGRLGVIEISILDQAGHLVKQVEFTFEYSKYRSTKPTRTFYGLTYSSDMLNGEESAVMGDMPEGYYRMAFKYNGQLYERRIEVKSGKLTRVVFVVQ